MWHDIVVFLMQPFWPTINRLATFIVCSYALLAGSRRERFVGAVYIAAYVVVEAFASVSYLHSTALILLADILCLPGFIIAGYKSPYSWTRWAMICQVLSVVADITPLAFGETYYAACLIILGILSYGVLISLLVGTMSAQIRRHRERKKTVQIDARNQGPD